MSGMRMNSGLQKVTCPSLPFNWDLEIDFYGGRKNHRTINPPTWATKMVVVGGRGGAILYFSYFYTCLLCLAPKLCPIVVIYYTS